MDFGFSQSDMESIQAGLDPSGATSGDVSATSPSGVSDGSDNQFFGDDSLNVMDFGRGSVTNISNAANFDPNFAALEMMSRGLTPGVDLRRQINFDVPASMLPKVPGDLVLNEAGDRQMYYSRLEKFLQETAPEIVRNFQNVGIGSLINKLGTSISEAFSDAKRAIGLDGGAQGGLKTEDLQPVMGTLDPSDRFLGDMSQQGAQIAVTDPVVSAPASVNMRSISQVSPLFDQFGNPYRTRADRNAAEAAQQVQSGGIASVAPTMAREANMSVDDATRQMADASAANFIQGVTSRFQPQINRFLKENIDPRINFESGFRRDTDDPDKMMPFMGVNIPFNIG